MADSDTKIFEFSGLSENRKYLVAKLIGEFHIPKRGIALIFDKNDYASYLNRLWRNQGLHFNIKLGGIEEMSPGHILDIMESGKYSNLIWFSNRVCIGDPVTFVCVLESGDLIFLTFENPENINFLRQRHRDLRAQFHYVRRELDYWTLSIEDQDRDVEFGFYLPSRIIEMWKQQNFDSQAGYNLKARLFSKVFVFIRDEQIPFRILEIDREWLNGLNNI